MALGLINIVLIPPSETCHTQPHWGLRSLQRGKLSSFLWGVTL